MGRKEVIILLLVACLVRFASSWSLGNIQDPLMVEPTEQVRLASFIAEGHGLITPLLDYEEAKDIPSAICPPGYPYILAGIFKLSALLGLDEVQRALFGQIVNIFVGSFSAVLIALSAFNFAGRRAFWFAGALSAFWPTLVVSSHVLWDTSWSILGTAWGLHSLSRKELPESGFGWLVSGLLAGLVGLVNPVIAPFLLLVAITRNGLMNLSEHSVVRTFLFGIGISLVILPYIWRNYEVFDRFIPIRNNFGFELWIGNHPGSDGTSETATRVHPMNDAIERTRLRLEGEDRYLRARGEEAFSAIANDPQRFLSLSGQRFLFYWFGDWRVQSEYFGIKFPMFIGVNWIKICFKFSLVLLAALSFFLLPAQGARWALWFGVAYFGLPYYFTHVAPLYRAMVDPILCLLAGESLARVFSTKKFLSVSGDNS